MKKSHILIIFLFVFLIAVAFLYILSWESMEVGYVARVVDGDTIELNTSRKVRLLGINTPEEGEHFFEDAKNRMEEMVLDKKILMEKDKTESDAYGRILRYIYVDGEMVNLKMVEEGLATVYTLDSKIHEQELLDAEREAISSKIGIWSRVSDDDCASCIKLSEFVWDAEGNDCYNPGGEFFVLSNKCLFECNLTGWIVKDSGTARFVFPGFLIESNEEIFVFSGPGNNSKTELYWDRGGSCPAVWNNDGDTFYLMDDEEGIVMRRIYQ